MSLPPRLVSRSHSQQSRSRSPSPALIVNDDLDNNVPAASFSVAAGQLPAVMDPDALSEFNSTIEWAKAAAQSPDFVALLIDLSAAFAKAYSFKFDEGVSGQIIKQAIADHGPVTFDINGEALWGLFGQFEPSSALFPQGRITIDVSLFGELVRTVSLAPSADHTILRYQTRFLMSVKIIHEMGHSMTETINDWIRAIYQSESAAKRRKIKKVNTPEKVGRMKKTGSNKYKGDSGNQLEQLLSGGFRFSYMASAANVLEMDQVIMCALDGKSGLVVPADVIALCLANPKTFYTTFKTAFAGAPARFVAIPPRQFEKCAIKCAHGFRNHQLPSHIKS